MVILCGIPLFYMEVLVGQFSGTGCTGMFRMVPILKGTGFCMVVVNSYCVCYYSVIISYPIRMLYYCFWKSVPWMDCNHSWNTPNCTSLDEVRSDFEIHYLSIIFDLLFYLLFILLHAAGNDWKWRIYLGGRRVLSVSIRLSKPYRALSNQSPIIL